MGAEDVEGHIIGLRQQIDDLSGQVSALTSHVQVDREMIAELQADGALSREKAQQMEEALLTSRTIGTAIGMIMASRMVDRDEAFEILKRASQHANRKLRDVAAELVEKRTLPSQE